MPWEDQMPGGLADDKTPDDFDPEQVLKGMKVEMEHTNEQHDDDESEAEVVVPNVQKAPARKRVFIEGDDLYAEVGSIADALFGRGADALASEALDWLSEARAASTMSNPYRARRS